MGKPDKLDDLTPGAEELVEYEIINELPEWFDEDRFRRGQEFYEKNFSSIMLAQVLIPSIAMC